MNSYFQIINLLEKELSLRAKSNLFVCVVSGSLMIYFDRFFCCYVCKSIKFWCSSEFHEADCLKLVQICKLYTRLIGNKKIFQIQFRKFRRDVAARRLFHDFNCWECSKFSVIQIDWGCFAAIHNSKLHPNFRNWENGKIMRPTCRRNCGLPAIYPPIANLEFKSSFRR